MRPISLKCTGCGAALEIIPDLDVFSCGYCGRQQMVRRGGGTISLKPLEKAVERVQRGTDRTASELAVRRLREELPAVDKEINKFRREFLANNISMSSGLTILMILIGGSILTVFTFEAAPSVGATAFIGTIVGVIAISMRQSSRTQARLKEAEKPLRAKRQRIETELQNHLIFLDSQSA